MPSPGSSAGRVQHVLFAFGGRARGAHTRSLAERLAEHGGIGPGFHFLRHALSVVILAAPLPRRGPRRGPVPAQVALEGTAAGDRDGDRSTPRCWAGSSGRGVCAGGDVLRAQRLPGRRERDEEWQGRSFLNRVLADRPGAQRRGDALRARGGARSSHALPLSQYFSDQISRYFGNIVGHVTFELPGLFLPNPWPGSSMPTSGPCPGSSGATCSARAHVGGILASAGPPHAGGGRARGDRAGLLYDPVDLHRPARQHRLNQVVPRPDVLLRHGVS